MSDDVSLGEWRCASCGEIHRDLPALVIKAPSIWLHADERERERDFELTTDTCIWRNEGFFVRCVLALPFVDREGSLEFGVWSSLSAEHFRRYMAASGSADRVDLGWMFGWFSNRLPGYPDTENLKCHVHPREPGSRPTIELEPTEHPLAVQQRTGIKFEEAVAYAHEYLDL
jgi:hypothetical protein